MEKHSLAQEFPEMKEKIHELKISDNAFKQLFDEYHEIDHSIRSYENGPAATTDEHLNELRLKRVQLKDALYNLLKN